MLTPEAGHAQISRDHHDASGFAYKTLVTFFIGWSLMLLCDVAQYTGVIGDITESTLKTVIWSVVVCVTIYFASRSSLTRGQMLALAIFAFFPMVGFVVSVINDIPALDNLPLVGRHGALVRIFKQFLIAGWGCSISFVFYQFLRSLDERTGELSKTVDRLEHEIKERERVEQILRVSQERFELAVRGTHDGIWDSDISTGQEYWSPRFKELLGYGVDEIDSTFTNFLSLLHPDDLSRTEDAVRRHFEDREPYDIEFLMRKKSGEYCWFRSRGQAVWNDEGKPVRMAGSIRDISDRKQAEKEIQQKDQQLENLLSNVDAIILEGDPFNFHYIGGQVEKILGYPKEMWFDHPDGLAGFWSSILHKDDIEKIEICRTAIERGENHSFEYRMIAADGKHIWFYDTVTVETENGKPVKSRCVMIDVTHRKQAELEREKLIEELEARNAEMERFTYTVSHDLKSPLITIEGFLGMLEENIESGNRVGMHSDMSRISGAADRMVQLLDELLELSRVSWIVNPYQDVSLADLAANAVELRATQISEAEIQVDISPDLPVVHGDQVRLQEVMQNLIDNAVKFTNGRPQPRIEIGTRQDGDDVICYVRDNGLGINPRYHEKIFGLFEQLDPQREGTGIGLAIVKRIIDVHRGRIWVESEGVGKGAMFCFTIPKTIAQERSSLSK